MADIKGKLIEEYIFRIVVLVGLFLLGGGPYQRGGWPRKERGYHAEKVNEGGVEC